MFSKVKQVMNALAFANVGHFGEFQQRLQESHAQSKQEETQAKKPGRSALATPIRHAHSA